jgi:hypothetical protein
MQSGDVHRHDKSPSQCTAWRALALAITLFAAGISGCAVPFSAEEFSRPRSRSAARPPLPGAALLSPQGPPNCGEANTADPDPPALGPQRLASTVGAEPTSVAMMPPKIEEDRNADLALRIKLEYERECYRQAEMRVRDRLSQLQSSVSETIKSVNRAEQPSR